ncbi:30S ribosomal protein S5 [Candidatus Gracilibacteria bacterium CG17_big_fil_post_rev_8_21_14_2_50_48_13]|nr:MAG: 30S ribosomal protein S5 [Candidatus Gracilibacteria bacterium CG17_big_fil_post_rev_8_21_14_2_50_48_13]
MAKGHKSNNVRKKDTEFFEEVLAIDRVTRVVSGGRRLRFRATVIVGNRNGKIGIGVGKANEVMVAVTKAVTQAKKNMQTIAIVKDTIPFPIEFKYKSAVVRMMPAAEGTGLIAGGAIRKVVELAGFKNIMSKSLGSSNKISSSRAALFALEALTAKYMHVEKVESVERPKLEQEAPKAEERRPARRPAPRKAAAKKTEEAPKA